MSLNYDYIRKPAVQVDLLQQGHTYKIFIEIGRNKKRVEPMLLLECFDDYYLFQNSKGRNECLLKSDLITEKWGVVGISIKERVLESAFKMQKAIDENKIKNGVDELMKKETMAKLTKECVKWIMENPNKKLNVKDFLFEHGGYDLNYYQREKIINEVLSEIEKDDRGSAYIASAKPKTIVFTPTVSSESEEPLKENLFKEPIVKNKDEVIDITFKPIDYEPFINFDGKRTITFSSNGITHNYDDRAFLENQKVRLMEKIEALKKEKEKHDFEYEIKMKEWRDFLLDINKQLSERSESRKPDYWKMALDDDIDKRILKENSEMEAK